jgi:tripartite-type tricarboxylate transporter receptor subunit TctC
LVGNTSVLAVAPAVSASAGYDPTRQLAAVAKFSESYQVLVVRPDFPGKTARELIAYAKRANSIMPIPGPAACRT